ncbi:Protein SABRE, partial [Linderina macrospora]
SIVKTRSLVEIENIQVFTANRDDFVGQAEYFVDCTYGSRVDDDAASSKQPNAIWPAWIPIEILLSQGKHKARGIFDELNNEDDGEKRPDETQLENDYYSDSSDSSFMSVESSTSSQQQTKRHGRRKGKNGRAWWLQDLSKYKRLMDRNNGLLVYDKANPHRILGDNTDHFDFSIEDIGDDADSKTGDAEHESKASGGIDRASGMSDSESTSALGISMGGSKRSGADAEGKTRARRTSNDRARTGRPRDKSQRHEDSMDHAESSGNQQGLSHRASHFAVFLPEVDFACTAEQYIAVYETVTDLIVYSDAEKASYMENLSTILLGIDMSDLRGLLRIIRATQDALRERLPIIHDWYDIQRANATLYRDVSRVVSIEDHRLFAEINFTRQQSRAVSLLTLDRHRRALELQLRTAMDLFGAAQKQKKQIGKLEQKAADIEAGRISSEDLAGRRPSEVSGLSMFPPSGAQGADHNTIASKQSSALLAKNRRTSHGKASEAIESRSKDVASSRAAEESHSTIARTIHLFISKATWHMLENDGQPLCDMTLRWASLKAVTTSDQATQLLSEVHLLYIINRLPNPTFTDLVGPYVAPGYENLDFRIEKMIRVRWSELAPVGGISIVERFEVELFPLRLQLSHDIATKLINYLYPPQESNVPGTADTAMSNGSLASSRADLPTLGSRTTDDLADTN